MSEREPQRTGRAAALVPSPAPEPLPVVGKQAQSAGTASDAPRIAVANAARDLAAVRDSAIPALIAASQHEAADAQADHFALDHAKHRVQSMLIAAAQRVSAAMQLPGGDKLGSELETTVATATALGAFVGYEALLAHVKVRAAPTVVAPVVARVIEQLELTAFEARLLATETIAAIGGPLWALANGHPYADLERTRDEAGEFRSDLETIRTRLQALRRQATALAAELARAGRADAAAVAVQTFRPAIVAVRARYELLGGDAAVQRIVAAAHKDSTDAHDSLGMRGLRQLPSLLGVEPFGIDGVKFEAGVGVGLVNGAGAAIRDVFVGAVDMMKLAVDASKDMFLGDSRPLAITAADKLEALFEHAPDLPGLVGDEIAKAWSEATTFGRGEMIGKIVGYIAMSVALAVASGSETLEAELAARGDALAAMALRLLRGIDAASNPLTYLEKIGKATKWPAKLMEWLRVPRRAEIEEEAIARVAGRAQRIIDEIAAIPVSKLPKGAHVAGEAAALDRDTYYLSHRRRPDARTASRSTESRDPRIQEGLHRPSARRRRPRGVVLRAQRSRDAAGGTAARPVTRE